MEIEDGPSVLGSIFKQLKEAAILHELCELTIGAA